MERKLTIRRIGVVFMYPYIQISFSRVVRLADYALKIHERVPGTVYLRDGCKHDEFQVVELGDTHPRKICFSFANMQQDVLPNWPLMNIF